MNKNSNDYLMLYKELFEKMESGVAVHEVINDGEDFRIIEFNKAAAAITKREREEILGNTFLEIFPHMKKTPIYAGLREVYKTGKKVKLEPFFYKDGNRSVWVENEIFRLESGEIVAILNDVTEKKDNEKLLSTILDSVPDVFGLLDDNFNVLRYNSAGYELFNTAPEDIKGKKCYEINGKEEPCDECTVEKVYKTKKPSFKEKYSEKFKKWLKVSGYPVFDDDDNIKYIVEHLKDITEEKRANEQIIRSERRFQKIFNTSNVGVVLGNIKGDIVEVNDEFVKILGYSREELLKMNFADFTYPDDFEIEKEHYLKLIEGKSDRYRLEKRYITKSGEIKWVDIGVILSDGNEEDEKFFIGMIFDISNRKKIENQLIDSEKKYRLLFENMMAAVALHEMIFDEEGNAFDYRFLEMNEKFEEFTGLNSGKITGKTVKEIMPNTEEYWINTYGNVVKKGEPVSFSNYSREIGKHFDCWAFATDIDKFAVMFFDVTDRELAKQQKEQLVYELRDKNNELADQKQKADMASKAKSDFVANMSHELRTPMNGVIGFTSLLSHLETDKEKKEYLNIINDSSEQLLGIINDVLNISKIESGKFEYEIDTVSMEKLLSNLVKSYHMQVKAKGLDFDFESDINYRKEYLVGSKPLLQILNNLLTNAIKFTDKGSVKFAVNMIEETEKKVKFEFLIKDTGIGINKEKQKRLYEPFDQGEYFLTKKYGGTGLGLAIVKSLVDLLNGEIEVKTDEGLGTEFRLRFYFEKKEPVKEVIKNKNADRKYKKFKVISAEDVEMNQLLIEKFLQEEDCYLEHVKDGRELIDRLDQEGDFDLILMDLQMPIMNGIDATRRIKSNPDLKHIPIIGISAFAFEETKQRAFAAGVDDYLTKPLTQQKFLDIVHKWL